MRVLLGLGEAHVRQLVRGEHFGDVAGRRRRRVDDRERVLRVVLGHRRQRDARPRAAARAIEAVEVLERQRPHDLPHAIGAEVEEHHRVAVADRADRLPVGADDDVRLDELVGDVGGVGRLDHRARRRRRRAVAVDDRVVGELGPLPALVAIHRPVAARDRRDAADAGRGDRGFERRDVGASAGRRRVASVGEDVHEDARHAARLRQRDERVQVLLVAVDAAVREQADQVQRVRRRAGAAIVRRRAAPGASPGRARGCSCRSA